jgi:hypothetical protein
LTALSAVFVLSRLFCKQHLTKTDLDLDDWFIGLAFLFGIISATINVKTLTPNGLGKDVWTLTPDKITAFAKFFYIDAIFYFFDVALLKLSILFFYIRIFPDNTIQRLLWGTVVFDILFGTAFVLGSIFQCTPIPYSWTYWRGEGGGTCVDITSIAWANATISIAIDIWMLALPLSQLPKLNMNWRKKLSVAMMFSVGTL